MHEEETDEPQAEALREIKELLDALQRKGIHDRHLRNALQEAVNEIDYRHYGDPWF